MNSTDRFMAGLLLGAAIFIMALLAGGTYTDYKFQERTAELFIECMEVADTNEQVIACNTRFHR